MWPQPTNPTIPKPFGICPPHTRALTHARHVSLKPPTSSFSSVLFFHFMASVGYRFYNWILTVGFTGCCLPIIWFTDRQTPFGSSVVFTKTYPSNGPHFELVPIPFFVSLISFVSPLILCIWSSRFWWVGCSSFTLVVSSLPLPLSLLLIFYLCSLGRLVIVWWNSLSLLISCWLLNPTSLWVWFHNGVWNVLD